YLADLIRFEQTRLLFNGYSKKIILRRFHYDIREIVRQLTNATGEPLKRIPQRKTLAVWFRFGKNRKPLHFVW
ncbi:MAG TPA: hypothetical protein VEX64_01735, partial [Pyrinomonadaceae bacterium]|nr:hypothetical protein [Pyrinomonadaceae bacterium]